MPRERTALSNRERCRPLGAGGLLRFLTLLSITLALCFFVTLSPCHLATLSPCHGQGQGQRDEGVPLFRRLLLSPERLPEALRARSRWRSDSLAPRRVRCPGRQGGAGGARKVSPSAAGSTLSRHAERRRPHRRRAMETGPQGSGTGTVEPGTVQSGVAPARFENGDALIAAFDGKIPALLVETAGERTVSLEWSARAESGPEGLQFHLEVPPCPVALLELDVPAGRGVTVLNDGAPLSGPHEAETPDLRRWKIICGGRGSRRGIDVRIHPADRPADGEAVALFVRQKTTQKLHPQGLDAAFELTLDGLRAASANWFVNAIRNCVCAMSSALAWRAARFRVAVRTSPRV